jgi:hypothetical protein
VKKRFRSLNILTLISIFITSCGAWAVQAQPVEEPASKHASYQTLLGKSVSDKTIADFMAVNNCTPSGPFQVCQTTGLALWTDTSQIVRTVYLYIHNSDGFAPYQGELPFGLKFYDTMGAVEYKLEQQEVGSAGLPDEGGSPDHMHYWATYHQAGMTIIYNFPYADEDATIYAILVSK